MFLDEDADEDGDDVGSANMNEEPNTSDVTNGEHAKNVSALRLDETDVVEDIYGDEDSAGEEGYYREGGGNEGM